MVRHSPVLKAKTTSLHGITVKLLMASAAFSLFMSPPFLLDMAYAQSHKPLEDQNVIVRLADCFDVVRVHGLNYDTFARASITNNGILTLTSVSVSIAGLDGDGLRYGPYAVTFGVNLEPGFSANVNALLSDDGVHYPACEASITSIKFADAPKYVPGTKNSLVEKLDEFETRISNLENVTTTGSADNARITALETNVGNIEARITSMAAMLNALEAGIRDLRGMIDDIVSGGTPSPGPTAPLSGTVYRDSNGNGLQDAGEPGVSGLTVIAVDLTDLSSVVRAVTGPDGLYSFDGMGPGAYLVQIEGYDVYNYITIPAGQTVNQDFAFP